MYPIILQIFIRLGALESLSFSSVPDKGIRYNDFPILFSLILRNRFLESKNQLFRFQKKMQVKAVSSFQFEKSKIDQSVAI